MKHLKKTASLTLLIATLLLVSFKTTEAQSIKGTKNAPIGGYLGLIPPDAPTHAFRAANLRCLDGQNMPGVSTQPAGQKATGVLRSKPFTCPPWLSFWLAGESTTDKNFLRLVDDVTSQELRRQAPSGGMPLRPYAWDLTGLAGRRVRLELVDGEHTTWIALCRLDPEVARLPDINFNIVTHEHDDQATAMAKADWAEMPQSFSEIDADGIPFLQGYWWTPRSEGDSITLNNLNVKATALHMLGCVNSVDRGYSNWGGGNGHRNYFIGDQIGTLTITYDTGQADEVPLIFGYTVWWRENYNIGYAPFKTQVRDPAPWRPNKSAFVPLKTDPLDQALINRALFVANGIKGENYPYYITIALRNDPVVTLRFDDNPDKAGYPVVWGLTFELEHGTAEKLQKIDEKRFKWFPDLLLSPTAGDEARGAEESQMLKWREAHTIQSANPLPVDRLRALEAVQRRLYTFADQITHRFIAGIKPDTDVKNFSGPRVRFHGPPEADLLTNIYLDNAADHITRIGENGMLHESGKKSPNFMGCAGWLPDLEPFYDMCFTRQRSLVVLSHLGFAEKVEKAIDHYNHWLMYYPRAWPEVQLGGKPVPGHWSVVCNKPHSYFDSHTLAGWPTKYKVRDFGNPENDGHGLTMLSHYTAWNKQGRTKDWVEARWEALNEAAEYIPWCLDNPELSFSEHGLLYNESEGGMMKASFYCDYPCWMGLLAYADMAEAAGKSDKAMRWREQAGRLFRAMEAYYPAYDKTWGDIWPRDKTSELGHATLAPVFFGSQFWGFDVANRLPEVWAERTFNTYRMELERTQPRYAAPSSMGYGHAYITQSALLLDQMADAAKMTEWMARLCFYPALEHPYRVPESAVTQSDGSMWWRRGDLGNTYQQAEVLYTTTVIVGVDDLDPQCLKIMPRLPTGWSGMEVNDWPARTASGGASELVKISYQLQRADADKQLELNLTADRPPDQSRVRLGPFPATTRTLRVTINGKRVNATLAMGGDSRWAWVDWPTGLTHVKIMAIAK